MLLPPGLRGLMFAAFVAALMSNVDAATNSASTLWTQDVLVRIHRRATRRDLAPKRVLLHRPDPVGWLSWSAPR